MQGRQHCQNLPIGKEVSRSIKMSNASQYDLKQNSFDPSKSSPPNDFMEKLVLRMSIYESFSKKAVIFANE
jgi:hypothetical protein